jgi:trans-2-enoyl-CoA reductase
MATTYSECIPLIEQLNHHDKLRLAQWLIKTIAQEEGINDDEDDLLKEEQQHIQHCLAKITQGDYSEFDDWETVKNNL